MRDRKQMTVTVRKIFNAWEKVPNLRLGQLIQNATGQSDPFYAEDDDLATAVERYVAECLKPREPDADCLDSPNTWGV